MTEYLPFIVLGAVLLGAMWLKNRNKNDKVG